MLPGSSAALGESYHLYEPCPLYLEKISRLEKKASLGKRRGEWLTKTSSGPSTVGAKAQMSPLQSTLESEKTINMAEDSGRPGFWRPPGSRVGKEKRAEVSQFKAGEGNLAWAAHCLAPAMVHSERGISLFPGDSGPLTLAPNCTLSELCSSAQLQMYVVTLFLQPALGSPHLEGAWLARSQQPQCARGHRGPGPRAKASRDPEKVHGQLCPLQGAHPTCRRHPQRHSRGFPGTRHCRWPTAVRPHSTSQSDPSWTLWAATQAVTALAGAPGSEVCRGSQDSKCGWCCPDPHSQAGDSLTTHPSPAAVQGDPSTTFGALPARLSPPLGEQAGRTMANR